MSGCRLLSANSVAMPRFAQSGVENARIPNDCACRRRLLICGLKVRFLRGSPLQTKDLQPQRARAEFSQVATGLPLVAPKVCFPIWRATSTEKGHCMKGWRGLRMNGSPQGGTREGVLRDRPAMTDGGKTSSDPPNEVCRDR